MEIGWGDGVVLVTVAAAAATAVEINPARDLRVRMGKHACDGGEEEREKETAADPVCKEGRQILVEGSYFLVVVFLPPQVRFRLFSFSFGVTQKLASPCPKNEWGKNQSHPRRRHHATRSRGDRK